MGEQEVSNVEMCELLPDILAAAMAGNIDVRVVVCFEVGPTGCFQGAPGADDNGEVECAEGVCGLDEPSAEVDAAD